MSDGQPLVDEASLREADRQLAFLEDVCLEEEESVPPWVIAARRCVTQGLEEVSDEAS